MAKSHPHKRRTREHVIADQSLNFVERIIVDSGHAATRIDKDYGLDLVLATFDEKGYVEPGHVYLQLKATDDIGRHDAGDYYWFDVDARDCRLWLQEPMPVVLVLYDAQARRAYWLHIQAYVDEGGRPVLSASSRTVRVRVPKKNRLTRRTMQQWRARKAAIATRSRTLVKHHV